MAPLCYQERQRNRILRNFLNWFFGSWNWLSNLISFRDNEFIFSIKGSTNRSQCALTIEIGKIYVRHSESTTYKQYLGDCAYYTLKYFWKTNEYNDSGWLLLMFLNKEVMEKVELRDLNLQIKFSVKDLKVSVCTLKETLISCGHSA